MQRDSFLCFFKIFKALLQEGFFSGVISLSGKNILPCKLGLGEYLQITSYFINLLKIIHEGSQISKKRGNQNRK